MLIIFPIVVMSCKNSSDEKSGAEDQSSICQGSFEDYTEIDHLKNYEKISGTAIYLEGNYEPAYRITQLKEREKTLILFKRISVDDVKEAMSPIILWIHFKLMS